VESRSNQFDRFARLDGTRRRVGLALGAALFGLAEAATAKKKKKTTVCHPIP
jgi:hypothetical protein